MRTLLLAAVVTLVSCGPPSTEDLQATRGGRVDVYFNDPGSRLDNMWESDAVDIMIETVREAKVSIDMAVMGFTREPLIDALVDAYDRGVQVRMVGDAGHLSNSGYDRFRDRHIPMVVGNSQHIMHNKFMVVDGRMVFGSTANWTDTDLRHNSNNFFLLDNPYVAADFSDEFEQLFHGAFGHSKVEIDNGRSYQLGDTTVEVWFSPNEDAMGRILELVDAAQESVRFTIFAFTKDQVGSAFIRKQEEFDAKDAAEGVPPSTDIHAHRTVAGVIDQSQLHSNGQYHEAYRLLGAGVDLRMDGNDNSQQPGDYQAGGGRLHSKTMILDAYGDNPVVITGSFNWSSSATQSNDEYMLVMHGARVAQQFDDYFELLWGNARRLGVDRVGEGDDPIAPGDIVINEVQWYGVNAGDVDGYDEFVELRNLTDRSIRLDMWQLAGPEDFIVGLPPGSVIPANGLFTILDHTVEPYTDGIPQDEKSAYSGGDLVVNAFNDDRQSRLYLKDGNLSIRLLDPAAVEVDAAGDGGPAFAGGPQNGGIVRSMERNADVTDGTLPQAWHACSLDEGGAYVNETYRGAIRATPGEANSPE
ncbi:MAG: lamin tail domain-containing protein [Alphaproteobacteria bacterium]|nr:lamin tail domain-containing protein [Alphaproteobacteria bacterium]